MSFYPGLKKFFDSAIGFESYLVIDSLGDLGVATGGIRMDESVTEQEILLLAERMTQKLILIGSDFGGAKAGIVGDPQDQGTKKIFLQKFAEKSKGFLEKNYFPGTDMGITYEDIECLYQTIHLDRFFLFKEKSRELKINLKDRFAINNVPKDLQKDIHFSNDLQKVIGGLGVSESVVEASECLRWDLSEARVCIQGFGKIGKYTAKYLHEKGALIIAVADKQGTVISADGFSIDSLFHACDESGVIDRNQLQGEFRQSEDPDAWLDVEADVIIPAAGGNAINQSNEDKIKAKLCVEAANNCIAEEIEKRMHERGIFVVPDIIANAGTAGLTIVFNKILEHDLVTEICSRIRKNVRDIFEQSRKTKETPRRIAINMVEQKVRENEKRKL